MKRSLFTHLRAAALIATGVFLGRSAQADTTLDFAVRPIGQNNNAAILQTFGDGVSVSSDGITVAGFGTPNINLTWQATGGRWDYYVDSVWTAGQLDSSQVGDVHEIQFIPNNPGAAVVIKSLNLHPYYVSTERYAYDISVVTNGVVAFGPVNRNFIAESAKVPVSLNYTGAPGQTVVLRLSRVSSSPGVGEVEGAGGNIAVDDIVFGQLPETDLFISPEVLAVSPANNQTGVPPDVFYSATITNGSSTVNSGSIQLRHSTAGLLVPSVQTGFGLTTVSYAGAALLPGGSTQKFTLTFADDSVPARNYTNEVQYTVANYVDIKLPAPIVLENFNATPEASLPSGWTAVSLDTFRDPASEPELTMTNLDSAAYTNWTVVAATRFTGAFDVYSDYYKGGSPPVAWTTDYQRVLNSNPGSVVNGAYVRNLATGRMVFGNSGYRNDSLGQVLYLYSPDFDLSGQTNVYLSFHSLWEQNQDSIAAVEYSIDLGVTWLPVAYYLDSADVFTNLDGSIDALTTLTNEYLTGGQAVATWFDSVSGATLGGHYGAFIGVESNLWSTLAPFISRRQDDNPVESKRVEIYRLAQADNQAKVRLRFAHAGTDSWYFGVDDVGLYSIPAPRITSITSSGGNVQVSWNGAAGTKLLKSGSLVNPNWQEVPNSDGANSVNLPASDAAGYFRLARPY